MEHIIYWNGSKYALTSSLLPINGFALEDKDNLAELSTLGLVATVQIDGVVPSVAAQSYQIVSESFEDLMKMLPVNEAVYFVDIDGSVCVYPPNEENCIPVREYYGV